MGKSSLSELRNAITKQCYGRICCLSAAVDIQISVNYSVPDGWSNAELSWKTVAIYGKISDIPDL